MNHVILRWYLTANATPVYRKARRYDPREMEFASKVFPEMKEAGNIVRAASDWGARTQFPSKKKGSTELRVVHNFIPINAHTMKPQWSMHRIEHVIDILIQARFKTWFVADASNDHWAVSIKLKDEYKVGIATSHGQYVYMRMGQGLKGAAATYSQFGDMIFGSISRTKSIKASLSLIGSHLTSTFTLFMDDHMTAEESFETLLEFLHTRYFPKVAFEPVYLAPHKTFVFTDTLKWWVSPKALKDSTREAIIQSDIRLCKNFMHIKSDKIARDTIHSSLIFNTRNGMLILSLLHLTQKIRSMIHEQTYR